MPIAPVLASSYQRVHAFASEYSIPDSSVFVPRGNRDRGYGGGPRAAGGPSESRDECDQGSGGEEGETVVEGWEEGEVYG